MFKKEVCRDCHFLSKKFAYARDYDFKLEESDRENVKNNNYDFLKNSSSSLYCFKEKWNENISGAENLKNDRSKTLNITKRNDCRYFHKYQSGATYKAIEDEISFNENTKQNKRQFKEKIYLLLVGSIIGWLIKSYN